LHLGPSDLLFLSRTSKQLRAFLISKYCQPLWRHAFRQDPNLPSCPPDVAELHWFALLFEDGPCQVCNTNVQGALILRLQLRACSSCTKKNLVCLQTFSREYGDRLREILPLVLHILIDEVENFRCELGCTARKPHFWAPQIAEVAKFLHNYHQDIQAKKPGAQAYLDNYRNRRLMALKSGSSETQRWKIWRMIHLATASESAVRLNSERIEQLASRFVKLGYDSRDVDLATSRLLLKRKLTYKGINKYSYFESAKLKIRLAFLARQTS
jgi:hypothetical protein